MKRLLYIAHRVPYPPDKGERVRAFHEIRALSGHFRVTLATLADGNSDLKVAPPLAKLCEKVIIAPAGGKLGLLRGALGMLKGKSVTEGYFHSPGMLSRLRDEAGREPFDIVLAYCSSVLPVALDIPAPACLIDLVDVDSAKWSSYAHAAGWPKRWLFRREARAVRRLEQTAVDKCDAVLLVSDAESAALGLGGDKVTAVANGVDCDFFRPDAVKPLDLGPISLVFTGTMSYLPNAEGVCWFVRNVWPELRRRVPELTFTIVGRDPVSRVQRLAKLPGLRVTGSVADVRPYLAAASVSLCPLQIARGIQNKILEAMAMERAVLASPAAISGLETEVGKHLLQAESASQWQEQVLSLLTDSRKREALARAARMHVRQRYSWASRMEPLVSLCQRLSCGPAELSDTPTASETRTVAP